MKNIIPVLVLALASWAFFSCEKDNSATVEVINQNSCLYNFYDGTNANGEFLGAVGALQTNTFKIELGSADGRDATFFADPQNCGLTTFSETYNVEIKKDKTTTILIN